MFWLLYSFPTGPAHQGVEDEIPRGGSGINEPNTVASTY